MNGQVNAPSALPLIKISQHLRSRLDVVHNRPAKCSGEKRRPHLVPGIEPCSVISHYQTTKKGKVNPIT
jgi:hypothetical protein